MIAFAVVSVALVGRPAWVVERLGLQDGDRRQREFDWRLTRLIDEFNQVLRSARETRPEGEVLEALLLDAREIVRNIQDLPAPNSDWADLVSMYVTLLRIHLDEFGSPLSDDLERYFRELNGRATVRREALRVGYKRGHSADSSREF